MKKILLKQLEGLVIGLKKSFKNLSSRKLWLKLVLYFTSLIFISALAVLLVNIIRFRSEYQRISREKEINLVNRISEYVTNYYLRNGTLYGIERGFSSYLNRSEMYKLLLDVDENESKDKFTEFQSTSPIFSEPLVVLSVNGRILFSNIKNTKIVTEDLKAYPVLYNFEQTRRIAYIYVSRLLAPTYKSPDLTGPIKETFYIIFVFSTLILFGTICLSFWVAYMISKPILLVSTAAKKIAENDFTVRVNVDQKDELGELANSFNLMAQKLEEANNSRIQMTADISHELRTPVSLIKSRLELIKEGIYKFDKKNLNLLFDETEKLATLIQELHENSKLEAGSLDFIFQQEELNHLAEIGYQSLKPSADLKRINLILKKYPEEVYISCDSVKILQAINNLISNAIKYTSENKKITIEISATINKAFIYIEDEGTGIEKSNISKIFDRFYKVDRARNREQGGSGLGLAICKNIIIAHNGEISVTSNIGIGTIFKIELNRKTPK